MKKATKSDSNRLSENLRKSLDTAKWLTLAKLTDQFHTMGRWAIINAAGTCTYWHQDAGGASSYLVVLASVKLWIIRDRLWDWGRRKRWLKGSEPYCSRLEMPRESDLAGNV